MYRESHGIGVNHCSLLQAQPPLTKVGDTWTRATTRPRQQPRATTASGGPGQGDSHSSSPGEGIASAATTDSGGSSGGTTGDAKPIFVKKNLSEIARAKAVHSQVRSRGNLDTVRIDIFNCLYARNFPTH